jgi:hypothetical protein
MQTWMFWMVISNRQPVVTMIEGMQDCSAAIEIDKNKTRVEVVNWVFHDARMPSRAFGCMTGILQLSATQVRLAPHKLTHDTQCLQLHQKGCSGPTSL